MELEKPPAPGSQDGPADSREPSTDPLASLLQLAQGGSGERDDGNDDGVSCTLTCNDRAAWMHGLWPCWGILNLTCSSSSSSGAPSSLIGGGVSGGSAVPRSAAAVSRHLLMSDTAGSEASAVGVRTLDRTEEEPATAATGVHFHSAGSMSFIAACKGIWTGALGKMCWGLEIQHSTATWPGGEAEKTGFCAGRLGVSAKKHDGGASMGQFCHGTHAGIVVMVKH